MRFQKQKVKFRRFSAKLFRKNDRVVKNRKNRFFERNLKGFPLEC